MSRRRVLVTGASRGLGAAVARAFVVRGDRVVTLQRTTGGDPGAIEIACDVGDAAALAASIDRALVLLDGLDICVINAAVRRLGWFGELPLADWQASVDVNLSAAFVLMSRTLPALRASRGHLIVVGSQAGSEMFEGGAAYCTTKAALAALTDVYRMETRDQGIRSTLVVPAAIRNRADDTSPTKLPPADVAAAILDLADLPPSVLPATLDLRPQGAEPGPLRGLARLQVY